MAKCMGTGIPISKYITYKISYNVNIIDGKILAAYSQKGDP
jgi:hypothetical protein